MKVLFVDVGQGTCQIILLGGGRAIVIDAGANADTAHRILKLNKIHTIELLAVSHSHFDHAGGVVKKKRKRKNRARESCSTGILVDYFESIRKIGFVHDANFFKSKFGCYVVEKLKDKSLREDQLIRLERTSHYKQLWPFNDHDSKETVLACISPTAAGNIVANSDSNANATSAIVELRHQGERILFTGDSEYAQWKSLMHHRKENGKDGPIKCVAITMPHHGGLMDGSDTDLKCFANETTDAEVVVVSVGTINGHDHPRKEVIAAMRDSGAHIICTQMTDQCCAKLETVRPSVRGPLTLPCRSSPKPDFTNSKKKVKRGKSKKRSRNVACAGTVEARLGEDGIEVIGLDKHAQGVDDLLANGDTPLCRTVGTK